MSLSDDDRKNLLRKYDEYVLNGLSHSDAGKKVGRLSSHTFVETKIQSTKVGKKIKNLSH